MRIKASRLRKDPQNGRLLALIATVRAQNAVSNHEAPTLVAGGSAPSTSAA